MATLVYRRVYICISPMIFHDISMFVGEIPFNVVSERSSYHRRQVGDEVTKDEPLTTNPNVGGFGQAPVVILGACWPFLAIFSSETPWLYAYMY